MGHFYFHRRHRVLYTSFLFTLQQDRLWQTPSLYTFWYGLNITIEKEGEGERAHALNISSWAWMRKRKAAEQNKTRQRNERMKTPALNK